MPAIPWSQRIAAGGSAERTIASACSVADGRVVAEAAEDPRRSPGGGSSSTTRIRYRAAGAGAARPGRHQARRGGRRRQQAFDELTGPVGLLDEQLSLVVQVGRQARVGPDQVAERDDCGQPVAELVGDIRRGRVARRVTWRALGLGVLHARIDRVDLAARPRPACTEDAPAQPRQEAAPPRHRRAVRDREVPQVPPRTDRPSASTDRSSAGWASSG